MTVITTWAPWRMTVQGVLSPHFRLFPLNFRVLRHALVLDTLISVVGLPVAWEVLHTTSRMPLRRWWWDFLAEANILLFLLGIGPRLRGFGRTVRYPRLRGR